MNITLALHTLEKQLLSKRLSKKEAQYCLGLVQEIKRSLSQKEYEIDCVLRKRIEILKSADEKAKEIIYQAKKSCENQYNQKFSQQKCENFEEQARVKCENIVLNTKRVLSKMVDESEDFYSTQIIKLRALKNKIVDDNP